MIYALGGGRGHATRCGVLRVWFPEDWEVHSVLPVRLREHFPGPLHHFVDSSDLQGQMVSLLAELKPDLLLVDTFPRGVLGELALVEFPCPAWLVARWVCLDYATRPEVVRALRRYQRVLQCELTPWEEGLDLGPVVAAPSICQPLKEAPVLWLGSGPVDGQREMEQLLRGWDVVRAAPELGFLRTDVPQLLGQARLVISAGGYNAYHQIVQAGTPAIFWPQDRGYDEQLPRVLGRLGPAPRGWSRVVQSPAELLQALQEWREQQPSPAGALTLARPERFLQLLV